MNRSNLYALLCASTLALILNSPLHAEESMMSVEKMMSVTPDTVDHAAVAAQYTSEAQALEEKAAMHRRIAKQYAATHHIPGQGSRSSHLAELWENMAKRYSEAADEARKIAQMQLELASMSH